jgi:ribonucleoside-diphosphate reductase alpha chain
MTQMQLNQQEFQLFPHVVSPLHLRMKSRLTEFTGLQKLVMLDRYSARDNTLKTLKVGDLVVAEIKPDPDYPAQGFGKVTAINDNAVSIKIEYPESLEGDDGLLIDLENFVAHKTKVVKPLETYWEQICFRAAKGVASVEKTRGLRKYWFKKFFWMLANQLAVPGGRILYGAGSNNDVTLFNCFVLDYIGDSRKDINNHRGTTMEIMSRGGGVGSNGSALRPKDTVVVGVNGKSSGSVSWLGDLANLTHLVQQGGSRRGAQMIGLGDWHPDIIAFILCKVQNPLILDKIIKEVDDTLVKEIAEAYLVRDKLGLPIGVRTKEFMTGANISVLTSHDLMNAVEQDLEWNLRFPDLENFTPEQKEIYDTEWSKMGDVRKWEAQGLPVKVYHTLKANAIWDLINIAARYSAEPGIIFIDECNDKSNSWYYAPLVVTNPCGEQPLPANAVCNLIAINMQKMKDKLGKKVNYALLKKVTHVSQRFADNVIEHSFYFLPENEKMAKAERRVGKGVMGLADLMIDLELPYGSEEMLEETNAIFEFIKVESYLASANIAEEKGSFEYYDEEKFLQSGFMATMPTHVIETIKQKGIRNVCSLTVAPTGSTGTMVGVATGLEPYFSFTYYRSGRLGKFIEVRTAIAEKFFAENPDATELPKWYVSSMQIGPLDHAKVQSVIQQHIDSAISKTCNAPRDFTVEQNKELYLAAWKGGCKGVTVYVDGSRDKQVLSVEAVENVFIAEAIGDAIEVLEEARELVAVGSHVNPTDDMLTGDTRVCEIKFDESGNMIKECH